MTKQTDNKEVQGINASQNDILKWLESELGVLIADQSSGLSDLSSLGKNLTRKKSEKQLTKHNLRLIKEDLQDGGLVDFEAGNRNGTILIWSNWKWYWTDSHSKWRLPDSYQFLVRLSEKD